MRNWLVFTAPVAGWVIAQAMKYAINLRKDGLQISDLYSSGGFPSAHTASMIALTTYIGATDGWHSHIFALAALISAIVMYDAIGVRRAVGEHSRLLRDLAKKEKVAYKVRGLHTALGHSPFEVLGGVILGVVIGLIVSAI